MSWIILTGQCRVNRTGSVEVLHRDGGHAAGEEDKPFSPMCFHASSQALRSHTKPQYSLRKTDDCHFHTGKRAERQKWNQIKKKFTRYFYLLDASRTRLLPLCTVLFGGVCAGLPGVCVFMRANPRRFHLLTELKEMDVMQLLAGITCLVTKPIVITTLQRHTLTDSHQ